MSGERFDEDLRSVLLEGQPHEVPETLRARVAAVPALYPAAGARPRWSWWRPIPVTIAGPALLALVVALALWRFGPPAEPGAVGQPSASASALAVVPTPSPAPGTEAPSVSPGDGSCAPADLAAEITGWTGAAGSRIADLQLRNRSAVTCVVRGTSRLALVDAMDRVLIASAGTGAQPSGGSAGAAFALAAGGTLRTEVMASNYCGPAPVLPLRIVLTLPSGGDVVAAPAPGVSSTIAVPPCMGSAPGEMAMNGWRR